MENEIKKGKTEYDLRQSRARLIGSLVEEKTMRFLELLENPDMSKAESYFNILRATYRNIKGYADKDDETEKIEKKIKELRNRFGNGLGFDDALEAQNMTDDLIELDDLVEELRMDVGLDIPRENKYDPESAGVAGLDS